MRPNFLVAAFLFVLPLRSLTANAQDLPANQKPVEKVNGFFGLQVGIPSGGMQEAIRNDMGNLGGGLGFSVLSNPFTWGKNKRNSPLRVGGEAGYTYYGRFLTEVDINGYEGDYKTSYGVFQLNAILQLRPKETEAITPFFEILAGGSFYLSRIKENLSLIETSLGIETFDLDSYSSSSFNKGIAVGCYIGNGKKPNAAKLVLRVSYNRGNTIKYIVRNSLRYDPADGQLMYESGKAPVNYFLVQVAIGK